ncbi:hypothetical protein CLOM_g24557 [Closterium sp. NIES-68]|nr:hypothetical protein CLOM_g24557 [Closterium sp. NIES-68]
MARRSVWRLAFVLFAIFLILSPAVTVRADDDDDDEDATAAADDVAADAAASEMVATEEEEEAEEELPRLMPAAGVEVKSILPKFFGKEPLIHAGQEAELLFSISNNGPIPVFMGNVTGNIYVPFDFRYVVQNFSSDSYNVTILLVCRPPFPSYSRLRDTFSLVTSVWPWPPSTLWGFPARVAAHQPHRGGA